MKVNEINKKSNNINIFKKIFLNIDSKILIILIIFIVGISISIYLWKIWYSFEDLEKYIWNNKLILIWLFLLIYSVRIFLFIPSTLIIIWLGLLSWDFLLTFLVSLVWILIWISQTYYIWYIIDSDLESNSKIKKIEPYLEKIRTNWFKYILFWCLTPIFPTDLICYSAWFIKYNFWKFILAWMLWEIPLILMYSYLWLEAEEIIKKYNYIFIIFIVIIILYFLFKIYKKKK